MKFTVITLFPEIFSGVFDVGMMRKAKEQGNLEVEIIDLREFGVGPRRQVDDIPYGGGDGMVLKPEPLVAAIEKAKTNSKNAKVLLMTPRGIDWKQSVAQNYSESGSDYIIVCGRYEGYDERIMNWIDESISIGDYVLTGGEIPALSVIDSVVRLIPGVLGGETSAELESFSDPKKKEHPHYTRPADFNGLQVPDVLLSGNHAEIEKWRENNSIYE